MKAEKRKRTAKAGRKPAGTAAKAGSANVAALKVKKILCIDYPAHNATVCCGQYSLRLGTPHAAQWVKISLNGGPWLECRPAVGYWWYDWRNAEAGSFTAEAVAFIEGEEVRSPKRRFKVAA
ncbi:MAG: hypothetical protein LBL61_00995 [Elusimicrobiota bacterium]|jgi:hypothetical protein|nr:hypothetical protein [Elusimicrobiota bacterium]